MTIRSVSIASSITWLLSCVLTSTAFAQKQPDCRTCARQSATIAACVECAKKNEGSKYTPAQMKQWCSANQPVCYKGKKTSG